MASSPDEWLKCCASCAGCSIRGWPTPALAAIAWGPTHHSSIAPTGTISLSLANNASNGIEPSFAHHYFRNVIREGKKSKEKIDVFSFELLAYRELVNPYDAEQYWQLRPVSGTNVTAIAA